jgi:hypothetical protein
MDAFKLVKRDGTQLSPEPLRNNEITASNPSTLWHLGDAVGYFFYAIQSVGNTNLIEVHGSMRLYSNKGF